MSKLNKLTAINNINGEVVDWDIIKQIKEEEDKERIKNAFWKYENKPNELTLREVSDLRKIIMRNTLVKQRNKDKVYLKYEDGFYMVALNTEDNLKKLSFDTNGFLHLLGFNINKSGIIIYKNNRPIRSFEKLRIFMGISDRVWRKIKKEIDMFDIIRKEIIKNDLILVLNPKYSSIAYEVTEYKFLVFGDYFKENLPKIDYLYLVKQFEIDNTV